MGDWDDITPDFETEPRLSDVLADTQIAWPTAAAIRGFIRASNRWSADTPISDAMVAAFRRDIIARAYAIWRARKAGKRVRVIPRGFPRRQRRALRVLLELMGEPWFQVGVALLTGVSAMLCWSLAELRVFPVQFRDAPTHMSASLLCYLHGKLALRVPTPQASWNAWELNPWHAAALNALSADAALEIYERLTSASRSERHARIDALFSNLERIGREAVAGHGEWLCELDPGPPRALVPLLPAEIEKARAARKKLEEEAAAPAQPAVPPGGGGKR